MEHPVHNGTTKLTLVEGQRSALREVPQPTPNSVEQITARIPSLLQTTLDVEVLLSLFEQQLSNILKFDSFHYEHNDLTIAFNSQIARHHRCHYKLEMNGQYLGELTLTRRQRFSDAQITLLEDLLCLLVYPLRNCLLYKQALAAALMDPLTGLGNRAAYEKSLDREVDLAKRQQTPMSMIILDIDKFKSINDQYGHLAGDEALNSVADTVVHTLRRSDIAFRYGGEEFVLILSNTDVDSAMSVAERLRVAIEAETCQIEQAQFTMTVSLGVAELKVDEAGYQLFERANGALYQAKQAGRNITICAN
jgi:diguanylate cyclase (GGDEF)-like protein